MLGGLRGWAAPGKDARVTAGELWQYAKNALDATLRGRNQTPELLGRQGAVLGVSAGEKGPSLSGLAAATAGRSGVEFKVSELPEIPRVVLPSLSEAGGVPRLRQPSAMENTEGIDFGAVDVDALGKYDEAVKFEKGDAQPEAKASRWRNLGSSVKAYADISAKRAQEWDDYAAQAALGAVVENDKGESAPEDKAAKWKELADRYPKFEQRARRRVGEWERYAGELAAAAVAKEKRDESMERDWAKLGKLLSYSVVSGADRQKFALAFVQAYGKTSEDNPYVAELAAHLPAGTVKVTPGAKGGRALAGISWVQIPGGSFMMGSQRGGEPEEKPAHRVTVKAFKLAKTEVTNKQYRICVSAGACSAPTSYIGEDDQPVVNVDWEQARKFSEWVGGRLPTEAEWEYAARSGGSEQEYPWGDEAATCERAVISDCGGEAARVCSKTAGNTKHGLCDMAGNVSEWTRDGYHAYNGVPADGSAWENPADSDRVYRGGSWGLVGRYVRAAHRGSGDPGTSAFYLGFVPPAELTPISLMFRP